MKRVGLLTIVAILIACTFTGCFVIPQYHTFEIDEDTVASIEIYDLYGVDSLYGEFLKTETPVYEIPRENMGDFLGDLAEIRFSDAIVIMPVPTDPGFYYDEWTVRIHYTDGSYELISCDGYGETYDENGEKVDTHHFGCDQEEWLAFIGKYLPQDIFDRSYAAA